MKQLLMILICIPLLGYSLNFTYSGLRNFNIERDSVVSSSETVSYYKCMVLTPFFLEKDDKVAQTSGSGEKMDTIYDYPGFIVDVPDDCLYIEEKMGKYIFIIPRSGIIEMSFINNFDMDLMGTFKIENLEKEYSIRELERLECLFHEDYERWGCNEDHGGSLRFSEENVEDGESESGMLELDNYCKYMQKYSKWSYDKIKSMLSDKRESWAWNNIRVRKDLYIIDFLFIKKQPYDILQRVATSFKMSTLEGIDVERSNERMERLNCVHEFQEDNQTK